jgi:hypothetical protein
MKDTLISFETAKLAKEKGFQEPVCDYYNTVEPDRIVTVGAFNHNYPAHGDVTVSAPTQSLLQKWLRETKNCNVLIFENPDYPEYYAYVSFKHGIPSNPQRTGYGSNYENVLEVGLLLALQILNKTK